jgi:hypothetical protein
METWIKCGQGTVLHPVSKRALTTERVEQEGFGLVGEWLDLGNDPERAFNMIVNAPTAYAVLDAMLDACEWADVQEVGGKPLAEAMEAARRVLGRAFAERIPA